MSGTTPDPPATRSSGPPSADLPDEVPADRPAHLQSIAAHDDLVQERRHLAALDALDGDVDLARPLGLGGDRVRALDAVAVLGGEAQVHVLAGSMAAPSRQPKGERPDGGRLIPQRRDRRELPADQRGHRSAF